MVGGIAVGALALGIGPALAAAAPSDIGPGSSVATVECVQRAVNFFEIPTVAVDGSYGPLTEKAVEQFQAEFGDSVDGIVGPQTGATIKTEVQDDIIAIHHGSGNAQPEETWQTQCSSLIP
ncbi:peptidoglycan-binding protein [Actinospica durhamensis]|uniref:Peptidoglycan-binding protein n=1 Tax=Actinospica durhamensis TaxID=1508375 RepID=A0A941ILS3_9ACTN|nr:peptidoglycan-binding domain-containing protein [Actinospica durhamensis]MBR7832064.1 peptidoglycan-binding protein [Actinospica durhamensis]